MINIYTWTDGTELYHHGILGQKWGIRRYQNPDGSLTDAGLKRYSKIVNKNNRLEVKKNKHLEKAEKYERKTPLHYLTDIGMHKQRKMSAKASAERGKASEIQRKIDKNNKKEIATIGKKYLESLKKNAFKSTQEYDDFLIESAKKFLKDKYQDTPYSLFTSDLYEGVYGEDASNKIQKLTEKMNSDIEADIQARQKIYRRK